MQKIGNLRYHQEEIVIGSRMLVLMNLFGYAPMCVLNIVMQNNIRYVHTNLIAKDWKSLSEFYIKVFGCKPIYPERDLSGEWLEKLTEIEDVRIRGIHLSLPGYENGYVMKLYLFTCLQIIGIICPRDDI